MNDYHRQWDEKQKENQRKCDEKDRELEVAQSKLNFLRLQLEQDAADATRQGADAVLVVQGRSHEPLHVHKFVLVRQSKP